MSPTSLEGTTSGIRIKSNLTRGGLVHDVVYSDICMRDSKTPVDLDTSYTNPGAQQNSPPTFDDITLHDVRMSRGGAVCRYHPGLGQVNLKMAGELSTVNGTPGSGTLPSCAGKFVPFSQAAH